MFKRTIAFFTAAMLLGGCAAVPPADIGYELAAAVYPQMAKYPDEESFIDGSGQFDHEGFAAVHDAWLADRNAQRNQPEGYTDGLGEFCSRTVRTFLSDTLDENRVYSPLNVFMALGMLAEVTDGESREQILTLTGVDNIEALRTKAHAVWNANYSDNGAVTSVLASSLWLDENISYNPETVSRLAEYYYASSFRGEMGSEEYTKCLQDWLNEQTGGLLKDQVQGVTLDPETILALATTVFYQAKWDHVFSESATEPREFHRTPDETETCDFMHRSGSDTYYWEDKFAAVSLRLNESGAMWFLLPDEGVSVDELITDSTAMDFLFDPDYEKNSKFLIVNMAVPKFDVSSDLELTDGLNALGITDVFDRNTADFTPITGDTEDVFLSDVKHAARVKIDEEGCTAAAYTVMRAAGAAMPPKDEVDFVLDRPFLFVLTGTDGMPLFVGVVNAPA